MAKRVDEAYAQTTQAKERLALVEQLLASARSALPNMQSAYSTYTEVATAQLPSQTVTALKEDMQSSFCLWRGEPPFTVCGDSWRGAIDFILIEADDNGDEPGHSNTIVTDSVSASNSAAETAKRDLAQTGQQRAARSSVRTSLVVTHVLEVPTSATVEAQPGGSGLCMPNETAGSDHFCLVADLAFVKA